METTIDELVDNLIKEKHLDGKESDEITETLELASKHIEPTRVSEFVKSIREKIDAPTSEIFTQNGLNLNELKNAAEVIANIVIEEQEKDAEKNKKNYESEYTQNDADNSNIDNEKTAEEQLKEKIEAYKSDLDDFYRDILGIDPENIPEEEKEEEAKETAEIEIYADLVDKYCRLGYSIEEAKAMACKELDYSQTESDDNKRDIALSRLASIKAQKRVEESNGEVSLEEALKEEILNSPAKASAYSKEEREQIERGEGNPGFIKKHFSKLYERSIELIQEEIARHDEFINNNGKSAYENYSLYHHKLDKENKIRELRNTIKKKDRQDGTFEKKAKFKKSKIWRNFQKR